MAKYDVERAAQALAMVAKGDQTHQQIADALGIGKSTLQRYLSLAREGKITSRVPLPAARSSSGGARMGVADDSASLARVLRERAERLRAEAGKAEALLSEAERLDQAAALLVDAGE